MRLATTGQSSGSFSWQSKSSGLALVCPCSCSSQAGGKPVCPKDCSGAGQCIEPPPVAQSSFACLCNPGAGHTCVSARVLACELHVREGSMCAGLRCVCVRACELACGYAHALRPVEWCMGAVNSSLMVQAHRPCWLTGAAAAAAILLLLQTHCPLPFSKVWSATV